MTEWGVVGVLVVLVGLGTAIITPVVKLNGNIVRNNTLLSLMQTRYDSAIADNAADHRRMHETDERLSDKVEDHEKRLTVIEHDHARNHG